ncbi:MAG: hypothetical protein M1819_004096 [Sarea resinae]|nr:MAG: hypothetical protein M1819_004096 [Sarea resinae]
MAPDTSHSDILIVGAGVMGISTAYHLSLSPPSPTTTITILDRAPFPSPAAASTDLNKIIRADYTSPLYMSLASSAIAAWSTYPKLQPFYHRTGWVMLNKKNSDLASRIRTNFRESGKEDPTSDMPLEAVKQDLGDGVLARAQLDGFDSAYANPSAGWADAADADAAMMRAAVERGVRYAVGEVAEVIPGGEGGVQGVRTVEGEVYTASKVLLATGAWTSALLAPLEDELALGEHERVESQATAAGVCVAHFSLDEEEKRKFGALPVVVFGEDAATANEGEMLPPHPPGQEYLKLTNATSFTNHYSTRTQHTISSPPLQHDQSFVPQKLKTETLEMVRRYVPQVLGGGKEVAYWRCCWDSITPTQHPLLSSHPSGHLQNLYLAIGGSFHSYKFLPIWGAYVAKVLRGESLGAELDEVWGWKDARGTEKVDGGGARGVHEKVVPRREWEELL